MSLNIRKQSNPTFRNLSILLYGMPKVGKSTEAARFPNALLLNCEPGGTDMLKGEHDIVDVASLDQLDSMIPELSQSDYKTIVIDGFTWLINQGVRAWIAQYKPKDRRRAYNAITEQASRMLGDLLSSGKIVVATGHSRLVEVGDDTHPDSADRPKARRDDDDTEKVEVRPDINPRLSDGVFGLFSIIGYCYASPQGSKILTKPQDNAKRRILAGDRSGVLPVTMPLDAKAMMEALKAAAQPQEKAEPKQPEKQAA